MSYYSCMYLVPKEIYDKLFSTIDENDKRKVKKLNNAELGNESGAFPNIPPDPNLTISSMNDNEDHANDPNSSPRNNGNNSSNSSHSSHNEYRNDRHNESTETANSSTDTATSTTTEGPLSPILSNNFGMNMDISGTSTPKLQASIQNVNLPQHLIGMSPFRSENVKVSKSDVVNILKNNNEATAVQVHSVIPQQVTSKSLVPIPASIIPTVQTESVRKRSHKCNVCNIEFPYVRKLNQHLKEKHPIYKKNKTKNEEKNSVEIPDQKQTILQENVVVPLQQVTVPIQQNKDEYFQVQNPYKCDICNIIFQDELIFLEHLQQHKNKTKLVNYKREFLTGKRRTNLKYDNWIKNKKTHIIKNKKKPNKNKSSFKLEDDTSMTETQSIKAISSDDEEMNIPTQSNIKYDPDPEIDNMSSDDDLAAFECQLCSFYFTTQSRLERHIKNIHEADKKYISKITQGKKRKTHETNHNVSYRTLPKTKKFAKFFYKCKLCVHTFSRKEALNRHILNVHEADEHYVSTLQQGQKRKRGSSNTINKVDEKNYKKWK